MAAVAVATGSSRPRSKARTVRWRRTTLNKKRCTGLKRGARGFIDRKLFRGLGFARASYVTVSGPSRRTVTDHLPCVVSARWRRKRG